MSPEAFRNAWRLMRILSWMQFENKSVREMAPVARQVGCLFSEIFATFFGIKSLNNLLLNKFKCKMARAVSYRGREQHSSCTNSNYNKQDFFPVPFFFFEVEPRMGSVSTTVTRIMHM